MGRVIMIASGKGGTGKTTLTANLGAALAQREKSVVVVDMDMGLRNLDVALGLESSAVYDVADIIENTCTLDDALIKHPSFDTLFFIPAPQTRDASAIGLALTAQDEETRGEPAEEAGEESGDEPPDGLKVHEEPEEESGDDKPKHRLKRHEEPEEESGDDEPLHRLKSLDDPEPEAEAAAKPDRAQLLAQIWKRFWSRLSERFDYVIIDSPAGIDGGFKYAACGADEAIIVTLAETAALRDADRVIDVLEDAGVEQVRLVINRIRPDMISRGIMMDIDTCIDMLGIPILGIAGDDIELISASLRGELAVNTEASKAGIAFRNIAGRIMGEHIDIMSFEEKKSFWDRIREILGIGKK